jgi:hypothetical protein
MSSVDFGVTLQRGTEWAATGKITQKIPPALSAGPDVVGYRLDLAKMDPNYGQAAALGPGGARAGTLAGAAANPPGASNAPAAPSAGRGQGGPSGDQGGCVAR